MVAIKDFGIPSCCENCNMCNNLDTFYCSITLNDVNIDEKPADCPLVEIEERKAGKWIRVDHTKVKCSNCDITHLIAQYPHGVIDYCPNCGSYNQSIIENERCVTSQCN